MILKVRREDTVCIRKSMLNINLINIEEINREKYELFRNVISEDRGKKADRFLFIEDSKRCVCAELLLQYSFYHMFNKKIQLNICYNEYLKPSLKHIDGFKYNISHSGKWVAIAYGSNEVGIDVERIQKGKVDIADRFFTEEEKKYIHIGMEEEQIRRFTEVWTLKESYIKYLGIGLSSGLNFFSVNPLDGSIFDQKRGITSQLRLKSYLFDLEYYLAICTIEQETTIHEISIEQMIKFLDYTKNV
jgi:4'-phosphopantetheinyl transferase